MAFGLADDPLVRNPKVWQTAALAMHTDGLRLATADRARQLIPT